MLENPTTVVIGGISYLCPPMPFYCLERAWPHIQKMGRMGALNQQLAAAQLQVRNAVSADQHASATEALATMQMVIDAEGADFIGQTREALQIIVAALALDANPPSYDLLSRALRPDELSGVHLACTELMEGSGLVRTTMTGEAAATVPAMPGHLNGAGSSPN